MTTALQVRPEVVEKSLDNGDDGLIHQVCEFCNAALCDGGECVASAGYVIKATDVLCTVCEDLIAAATECPYCDGGPRAGP